MAEGTGLENRHTGEPGIESSNLSLSVPVSHHMPMPRTVGGLVLLLGLAACGDGGGDVARNDRDTMTQRQRDSVLAQSRLPGAQGVGMAIGASDSAKARQAQLDSASRP